MRALFTLTVSVGIALCIGCNIKVVPLTQSYQDSFYNFSVASGKEAIMNRLVEIFTSKGLAVGTIDKSSGLITTNTASFLNSYTIENKDGSLKNPAATVVCSKVRGPFTFPSTLTPSVLSGQWTAIIKEEEGKSNVALRLANATGNMSSYNREVYSNDVTHATLNLDVKSTGVFEKEIEQLLKQIVL